MTSRRDCSPAFLLRALGLLGLAALGACGDGAPEVGRLPALEARPAERIQVVALGAGQTLGGVLAESLDGNEQQALLMAFREQASPRRMRVGTEITLHYVAERGLRSVDVGLNADETVRLTRERGGWGSEMVQTPLYVDTLLVAGIIDESLWTSLIRNRALTDVPREDRGVLVDYLDRVFQWQLDFSRQIQRGDGYRVAFEREVRPDGSMRRGHVLAAEFVNVGTPYDAVWFDPNGDGQGSYYDLEGRSVRRSFLLKPLTFRRISSRFTTSRYHPILKTWRAHKGVDYAADAGTPIMATADGVVQERGVLGGLGKAVVIRHPNGFVTRYGHMSRFAQGVHVGSRVHQSEVIGYVGATGLATAPHLHYEMIKNGRNVDPLAVELPAGDPVPADDLERWRAELTPRLALLDRLPVVGNPRVARSNAGAGKGERSGADASGYSAGSGGEAGRR